MAGDENGGVDDEKGNAFHEHKMDPDSLNVKHFVLRSEIGFSSIPFARVLNDSF